MKVPNPFDDKLTASGRDMPRQIRAPLLAAVDTLEFCWVGCQAVFEDKATPEQALQLLDIVLKRSYTLEDQDRLDSQI